MNSEDSSDDLDNFLREATRIQTDEHEEGEWRWIDGTPVDLDAWSDRQPFNMLGREHYMEIGPAGGFNDVSAEGPTEKFRINGFICEWDLTAPAEVENVEMTVGSVR